MVVYSIWPDILRDIRLFSVSGIRRMSGKSNPVSGRIPDIITSRFIRPAEYPVHPSTQYYLFYLRVQS
jgi:hypothetical protein